jgi:phosphatidyl-myo-inositol dimannoside synthase
MSALAPSGEKPAPATRNAAAPRLRVAFLDSWRPSSHDGSGTAVAIANLERGLQALGHRVTVLRPRAARGPLLLRRLLHNLALPARLRREGPFDLVVGFDIDGVWWSARARHPRPGFVVALKGIAADEARFAAGGDRILLRLLARLERRNAQGASAVLVPSRYSAEVARARYDLLADRVRVVPEPLDLEPWDALIADAPPRPAEPTILSVARQYPRKDTATLLRALPLVRDRIPDVRLRIVGGGPELPRLRRLARTLDLSAAVVFEGALADHARVRRAYHEAHVFCLPSLQEGFGIVFLEAMAAGLPVVAVRAAAVPEVVRDGETGLLVPPRSPERLADALGRLLSDSELRAGMSARARRAVREYALPVVAGRFLDAAVKGAHP